MGGHEGNNKSPEHLVSNMMPFTQETDSKVHWDPRNAGRWGGGGIMDAALYPITSTPSANMVKLRGNVDSGTQHPQWGVGMMPGWLFCRDPNRHCEDSLSS